MDVLTVELSDTERMDEAEPEEVEDGSHNKQGRPIRTQTDHRKLYWTERRQRKNRFKKAESEASKAKPSKPKSSKPKVRSEVVVVAKQAVTIKQPGPDAEKANLDKKKKKKKSIEAKRRARQKQRLARREEDRKVRALMGDPCPEVNDDEDEADMPKNDTFANIGVPPCFWDNLSDDDVDYHIDEDALEPPEPDDDFRWRPKSKPKSTGQDQTTGMVNQRPIWNVLRPLELRAMALARRLSCEKELVPMPKVSEAKAEQKVEALRVFNPPKQKVIAYGAAGHFTHNRIDRDLEDFYKSVYKYHFFSFDTEGNGELVFTKGPNRGKPGRSILVLGSPAGDVIVFYDPSDISQKLRNLFADPTVLKLQSGIEHDVALLPFRIFGLVDSGCFVPFLDNASPAFGIKRLHELVYPDGPKRVDFKYHPFKKSYVNETFHLVHEKR